MEEYNAWWFATIKRCNPYVNGLVKEFGPWKIDMSENQFVVCTCNKLSNMDTMQPAVSKIQDIT